MTDAASIHMYIPPSPTHVQDINALLKKAEFVIVPVVNPDGYLVSYMSICARAPACLPQLEVDLRLIL